MARLAASVIGVGKVGGKVTKKIGVVGVAHCVVDWRSVAWRGVSQ